MLLENEKACPRDTGIGADEPEACDGPLLLYSEKEALIASTVWVSVQRGRHRITSCAARKSFGVPQHDRCKSHHRFLERCKGELPAGGEIVTTWKGVVLVRRGLSGAFLSAVLFAGS